MVSDEGIEMFYEAVFTISKKKGINYKSLLSGSKSHPRSKLTIKENATELNIKIHAEDLSALMASSNTVFKEIKLVEQMYSISINSVNKAKSKNI